MLRFILLVLVLGAGALAFRLGMVPWALNPLPALDLATPSPWFADWRLAAMKYNPALCRRVLVAPHIDAQPVADNPLRNGCG